MIRTCVGIVIQSLEPQLRIMERPTIHELHLQILKLFCTNKKHFLKYYQVVSFNEVVLATILEQIRILYQHTSENYIDESRLVAVLKLVQVDEIYASVVRDIYQTEIPEELLHELLNKITNQFVTTAVHRASVHLSR